METGTPISVTHTLVNDRHIPDPMHQFAVGSVSPFMSTGSVTRSAAMHLTPDPGVYNELPESRYEINGQVMRFKVASFRYENNVANSSIPRYELIYDAVQGWNVTTGTWRYWENATRSCISSVPGPMGTTICTEYSVDQLAFMDYCAGELMSYDDTAKQCRKIIDSDACQVSCWRAGGEDCATTCSTPMPVPWYCGTDYVEIDPANHAYRFPFLEALFAFAKGANTDKAMGLQSDTFVQTDSTRATTRRTDTTAQAETLDTITMDTHNERRMVSKTIGDTTTNTNTQTVVTDMQRDTNRRWRTPWD